jgi:L-ascorbate metabolism protein UlaG (beta-lactamase superfamily)
MHVEWYGQSAFRLAGESATVFIDPFGDTSQFASRGIVIDYPPISGVLADLLLVTHEHADHNGVEAIGGDPVLLRSTAGKLASPIGTIVAVASEHDSSAGTERGPNTIFAFVLDGVRVAHFGDFGQSALREEQAAAIGEVDLLFVPVGAVSRSAAPLRRRSWSGCAHAGWSRCTTGPSGSTSSRPPRTSSRGWTTCDCWTRPPSTPTS